MGVQNGTGEMTLVFELSALRELADPRQVFAQAEVWSRYLGVVANDTDAVKACVEKHHLRQDFDLEGRDKWLAMQEIRNQTRTERHVFVAMEMEDRRLADTLDWEYVHLFTAAEKADWRLADEADDPTVAERFRSWFATPLWPFDRP